MNEVKIVFNGKPTRFKIAEGWKELSLQAFKMLAHILMKTDEQMPPADKQVRAFAILCGKNLSDILRLSDEELYALLPLSDWVFKETCELELPRGMVFRSYGTNYYAPESFDNLRFREWCYADTYLLQYLQSRDHKLLDKFFATLCRPAGKGDEYNPKKAQYRGESREKFNPNLVENRAIREVYNLNDAPKSALALWFLTNRNELSKSYPDVFPEGSEKDAGKAAGRNYGWLGIFDELTGEKGRTAVSLEDEPMHDVFLTMQRNQEKAAEIESKYGS